MKIPALLVTAALVAVALVGPAPAAQASSIYDVATLSSIRNMTTAMTMYSYFGPTGSYEGVSVAALQEQGWSPQPTVKYDIWVEDGGHYRATAQDTRNGSQYTYTTTGTFNGRGAGNVGLSSLQPATVPSVALFNVSDLNSSINVDGLATALAAGTILLPELCNATLFVPGTHQAGSSVSDQSLARMAAANAPGATTSSVLLALRTAGGTAALATIAAHFVGAGTSPASTPAWVNNPNPKPSTAPAPPAALPGLWRLPKSAPQFAAENGVADSDAQTVLSQCFWLVAVAGVYGDPYEECKEQPIFASGRSDVPEATDHDLEALTQSPVWVKLDYRPSAENPSNEAWYYGSPECPAPVAGLNCDEYPFRATVQGGATALPLPSLKLIDGAENQLQGSRYSSFLYTCHVRSKPVGERGFLAIPLPPSAVGVPTLALCNGN